MPAIASQEPRAANIVAQLPPFPAVARKLLSIVQGDYADFAAVAKLIQSDAAFSAEVLRLANSALFATRYEVVSILHAISVLGVTRLKAMVLTVGLKDFVTMGNRCDAMRRCWRHNLASALMAEALADCCDLDAPESYSAGLLHGVGHVALIATDAEAYCRAADSANGEPGRLLEREQEQFGLNHVDAAQLLVRYWGLPFVFEEICRCDHWETAIDPSHPAGVAEMACDLASMLGFSFAGGESEWDAERVTDRLPERYRKRVSTQTSLLVETIPFKLNLFEQEFFR
jgi:HD-like signal output (HDOD) protein